MPLRQVGHCSASVSASTPCRPNPGQGAAEKAREQRRALLSPAVDVRVACNEASLQRDSTDNKTTMAKSITKGNATAASSHNPYCVDMLRQQDL